MLFLITESDIAFQSLPFKVIQAHSLQKSTLSLYRPADLHNSLGSLSGLGSAFNALRTGWRDAKRILPAVLQLFLFWLATAALHITMPALISVSAFNMPTPTILEVTTMPGNIIDIGVNLSAISDLNANPFNIYSRELVTTASSVSFLWTSRNTSIRTPSGMNDT